jgi:hypothetical protein
MLSPLRLDARPHGTVLSCLRACVGVLVARRVVAPHEDRPRLATRANKLEQTAGVFSGVEALERVRTTVLAHAAPAV